MWNFEILKKFEILISSANFEIFEILKFNYYYFFIDFRILKFYEIFLKSCFPFEACNGLFPIWVNFHKTLKLFQVMWFNLSQWEVSEV